jgi:hypothetical protein
LGFPTHFANPAIGYADGRQMSATTVLTANSTAATMQTLSIPCASSHGRCRTRPWFGLAEINVPGYFQTTILAEIVVGILYWFVIIVVLVALWYSGMLRPTGLAGRPRADEEKEGQQDAVAKWLKDRDDRPL